MNPFISQEDEAQEEKITLEGRTGVTLGLSPWLMLMSVSSFPGEITPKKVLKTNLLYIHGEVGRDLAHCVD